MRHYEIFHFVRKSNFLITNTIYQCIHFRRSNLSLFPVDEAILRKALIGHGTILDVHAGKAAFSYCGLTSRLILRSWGEEENDFCQFIEIDRGHKIIEECALVMSVEANINEK